MILADTETPSGTRGQIQMLLALSDSGQKVESMHHRRIVPIASLLALGLVLSACSTFDPTEWFNTKKPLPGERRAVFPEGVPGVPEGVPADLVQGYVPPTEPVPEPRVIEEPKPKAKPKPRPKQAPLPLAPRCRLRRRNSSSSSRHDRPGPRRRKPRRSPRPASRNRSSPIRRGAEPLAGLTCRCPAKAGHPVAMNFTIAIVGRPNVGKSTLFNRLVGRRMALVDDMPGVTRDRREGQARLGDLDFTIIDTAGLEAADAESLAGRMLAQTKLAIEQADAVFFMLDAKTGPVPDDRVFADLVRRSGKPVIVVANKAEGKGSGARVMEAYELGLGDPVGISAEHGEGLVDLFEALREALPDVTGKPEPPPRNPPTRSVPFASPWSGGRTPASPRW